jgi:DNA-binding Lrp family transcriptional regulator
MAGETKIIDCEMLRMVNNNKPQAEIARHFGVSPSAVCKRLRELRGKTTLAMVAGKISNVIDSKINTFLQLEKINKRANNLLDQAEGDVQESALMMREIREQLKLQMELFKTMWDVRAAMEFQDTVMTVIGKIDPEVRKKILTELNAKSAIRNAITFR